MSDVTEVDRICLAALEQPPSARTAFIADACRGDEALRREVESLLAQAVRAEPFMEQPAVAGAGALGGLSSLGIGQRIGPYQIVAKLGAGGMGEVYRAHDTHLGREVAIKVLPVVFAVDPDRSARFEREARLLASLNHPHIATVYGVETAPADDGVPRRALVMELIEGPTLAERIQRGPLPMAEALPVARQIAEALGAAHEQGIIHRDLKPANVKVRPDGTVKVLDFGLAKEVKPAGAAVNATASPTITTPAMTHAGVLLGTAAYMSPEQARGDAVESRTDIWAFGCVLYEMLVGRPVFDAPSVTETLSEVLKTEPDWRRLPSDTPDGIRRLLGRCLTKDRTRRLADIRDAHFDLTEVRSARRRLWLYGAAVAALLLAATAGTAVWRAWDGGAGVHPVRSMAVLPLRNFTGHTDLEFVADGTTEELVSTLAQIPSLRVIGHRSVSSYKDSTKSAGAIARELGVDVVLEGAVRESNGRLRVSAALIDAASETSLWAKTQEGAVQDLLAIQEEIARAVASVIVRGDDTRTARVSKPRTTSPAAYEEILKGQAFSWRDFEADARSAIAHFQRATELDPGSAIAHAYLSDSWGNLSGSSGIEPARRAASRALALDPDLPEAHNAMAIVHYRDHEWEAGFAESRRALALSPNSADLCYCFVVNLAWAGRDREALDVAQASLARNPRSPVANEALGMAFYWARRYTEAAAAFRRVLELDPNMFGSRVLLAYALAFDGRPEESIALLDTPPLQHTTFMAFMKLRAGRREEGLRLLRELTAATPPIESNFMAVTWASFGDHEQAMSWLTRAVEARETRAAGIIDQGYDSLRADPRFHELVKRLKMPASYDAFLRAKGVAPN